MRWILAILLVASSAWAHEEYHFDLGDLGETKTRQAPEFDYDGPIDQIFCDVSVSGMRRSGGIEFWIIINGSRDRADFNQSIRVQDNGRYAVVWDETDTAKMRVPKDSTVGIIPQAIQGLVADIQGKCRLDKGHGY